jgi:hypothetical protein
MVGPIVPAGGEQAGGVEVCEGCLLALEESKEGAGTVNFNMQHNAYPEGLTILFVRKDFKCNRKTALFKKAQVFQK